MTVLLPLAVMFFLFSMLSRILLVMVRFRMIPRILAVVSLFVFWVIWSMVRFWVLKRLLVSRVRVLFLLLVPFMVSALSVARPIWRF